MNIEAGLVLNGKYQYRTIEVIYQDANSALCLARMPRSGQLTLLKVLVESAGRHFTAEFQREMVLLNEIDSPFVPHIVDYGTSDGHFFAVMENVEGLLLSQVIDINSGRLREGLAFSYLEQIAEALVEMGRHGIVHGEIRPQSVMVMPDGRIKLLGFGVARDLCLSPTGSNEVNTAFVYAAPELLQANGKFVLDARADIYSVGAIAYEMLTGHSPFEGVKLSDLVYMIVMETRTPASEYNPDLSAEIEAFLMKCLAKDPGDRYQTPNDLLVAIQALGLAELPHALLEMPARKTARLVFLSSQGIRYTVPDQGGTLGRNEPDQRTAVAVDLNAEAHGRTVSRRQAQLQRVHGQWVISPYPNTTNPVLLNGSELKPGAAYPLSGGDELQIGGVKLVAQLTDVRGENGRTTDVHPADDSISGAAEA
jgi:serine/threonine protein kinase